MKKLLIVLGLMFLLVFSCVPVIKAYSDGPGMINNVVDTWEYDIEEGKYPDMIRLGTSQYYAVISTGDTGTENDGFIRTIKVWNSNGTIQKTLVDKFEYDTSDGIAPSICLVYGDMYAISYYDDTANKQTVVTVNIDDADGQIVPAVTDTQQLTYDSILASRSQIIKMNNNIFVVVYTDVTNTDLWLETCNITNSGDISVVIDSLEIDATDGIYPYMSKVDDDTVVIAYDAGVLGSNDGYMSTWNINSTGIISDAGIESAYYGGIINAVVNDTTYFYVAGASSNKVYQYWKSNMTKRAETLTYGGIIYALAVDDTYVYAGGATTLRIYQYWKSNMTKKANTTSYGGTICSLTQDATYIYAGGATVFFVRQYLKSTMALSASSVSYGGIVYSLTSDSTYVYAGGATTLTVRQYWKSNMTYKTQTATYGGIVNALASDDLYIYAGGATTLRVRQYWKSNMTYKAQSSSYGYAINALAEDNTYVYVGGITTNKVYQYWKTNLTFRAQTVSYGGEINAITEDTIYIYVGGVTAQKIYRYWKSNMTRTGYITSWWEYDANKGSTPTIAKVTGNIFMIAYADVNSMLYIKTCTIADTGDITPVWINTLLIDIVNGDYPSFFNISTSIGGDEWIKGITFSGERTFQYVTTFFINDTGFMSSTIDRLEFLPADVTGWYIPVCQVNGNYFLIINQDSGFGGWCKTIDINLGYSECPTCNSPNLTVNENIVNCTGDTNTSYNSTNGWTVNVTYTGNETICPECPGGGGECCPCIGSVYPDEVMAVGSGFPGHVSVELTSCSGNLMNLSLYENSSGSWLLFNSSVNLANGTYDFYNISWMDEFDTAYYWKINVSDGNCTLEKIITFTTDTNAMNITFEATQFGVFLGFLLFALFFILGYFSKKRSGGFFLIFSGFTLIGMAIVASTYLTVYVSALMIPFAGFICLLGVKKAFYNDEADEKERADAQAQPKRRKR